MARRIATKKPVIKLKVAGIKSKPKSKASKRSGLELALYNQMTARGITGFTEQYRFHKRRWMFDFVFLDLKVAIELQGGTWTKKKLGHTSGKGYAQDQVKYNTATSMGWKVYAFTSDMVMDGIAVNFISCLLKFNEEEVTEYLASKYYR